MNTPVWLEHDDASAKAARLSAFTVVSAACAQAVAENVAPPIASLITGHDAFVGPGHADLPPGRHWPRRRPVRRRAGAAARL